MKEKNRGRPNALQAALKALPDEEVRHFLAESAKNVPVLRETLLFRAPERDRLPAY